MEQMKIHSIQPYFVLKTDNFCQRVLAACGISHFYGIKKAGRTDESVPFVPDGCSNILFAYKNDDMSVCVIGPSMNRSTILLEKDTDYFGVRFQPGENPCFSELPVKELVDTTAPAEEFRDIRKLTANMADQNTFTTRMCTFLENYRGALVQTKDAQHELFRQICRIIVERSGLVRIGELETLTGYSARYINYLFAQEAGYSAKQFCQTVRLQDVLSRMNSGRIESLSKLAEDFRFYDQSHFIHDFETFAGTTPSSYLEAVEAKEYRKCVINA